MVEWCNEKVDAFINEMLGDQTTGGAVLIDGKAAEVCAEKDHTIVDQPMSNDGDTHEN
jgi:hypothetical protein